MNATQALADSSKPHRLHWFRFSLRTLLVVITILCVLIGLKAHSVRQQKRATDRVRELGGHVRYEYQIDTNTGIYVKGPQRYQVAPRGPRWLRELIGAEWFNTPHSISLSSSAITDEDLRLLLDMPELRSVGLEKTYVSDAGLKYLEQLEHLERVYLNHTNVTEEGIARLRQHDPEIIISYIPGSKPPEEPGPQWVSSTELAQSLNDASPQSSNSLSVPNGLFVPVGTEATRLGVLITPECVVRTVHPGSPADLAGIRVGDIILRFNGDAITGDMLINDLLERPALGATADVELSRAGNAFTVQVRLDGAGH